MNVASMGSSTARNGFATSMPPTLVTYIDSAQQPNAAPTHIVPGMPRLRCPDFSVSISPVEPNRNAMLERTV